jgi:hypothetical protein
VSGYKRVRAQASNASGAASASDQRSIAKRIATVEPVFGQLKFNRRFDRFQRRGRSAARSE